MSMYWIIAPGCFNSELKADNQRVFIMIGTTSLFPVIKNIHTPTFTLNHNNRLKNKIEGIFFNLTILH